jgi:TRAP-type C4-dicarboxylate transport system permease small subunit
MEAKPAAEQGGTSLVERIDSAWQALEARLCAGVLVAEIASLTLWISLKGLSTDYVPGANASGLVYRCVVGATALGLVAHLATRRVGGQVHRAVTTAAVILGLATGRLWAHVGVVYASNVLNWLQNASVLMLIGGLRGLATRLTLWLALLGASLATSRGKHIHVDVLLRYLPRFMWKPAAVAGQLAAALVCTLGVVGFVDYIGIAEFRANAVAPCPGDPSRSCDTPPGERFTTVRHELAADFFVLGRQASLDAKTLPHVVAGTPYDKWMTADEWNAWLDGAAWTEHYQKSAVAALHMDPSAPGALRTPQIAVPGTGEEARGLLIRELNFVFPVGLAVIALKFLLRVLLLLTGRVSLDPEAALQEEDLANAQERDDEAAHDDGTSPAPPERGRNLGAAT